MFSCYVFNAYLCNTHAMAQEENKPAPKPEVWMRGPIDGIPALLQPVAHTLLQASEEIEQIMHDFPDNRLWHRPEELASVAFHLQHIPGVLDRLFTYSRGEQLDKQQLKYLSEEGLEDGSITRMDLVTKAVTAINNAVDRLKSIDPEKLTEPRTVGRRKLPTTVMGLLFHSAEHTMRHTGQLLVTAKVIKGAP